VHPAVEDDPVEVDHRNRVSNDRMVVAADVDENEDVASLVVDHRHHLRCDVVNLDCGVVGHSSSFA
jgi:hypothetical protein